MNYVVGRRVVCFPRLAAEGLPGKAFRRPEFERMMRDIESGHINTVTRSSTDDDVEAGTTTDETQLSGLHAKIFIADHGFKRVYVWSGSANASNAAFAGPNVEFVVRLIGTGKNVGVDAVLGRRNDSERDTREDTKVESDAKSVSERMADLEAERANLEEQLTTIKFETCRIKEESLSAQAMAQTFKSFGEIVDAATPERLKELMPLIVEVIEWHEDPANPGTGHYRIAYFEQPRLSIERNLAEQSGDICSAKSYDWLTRFTGAKLLRAFRARRWNSASPVAFCLLAKDLRLAAHPGRLPALGRGSPHITPISPPNRPFSLCFSESYGLRPSRRKRILYPPPWVASRRPQESERIGPFGSLSVCPIFQDHNLLYKRWLRHTGAVAGGKGSAT